MLFACVKSRKLAILTYMKKLPANDSHTNKPGTGPGTLANVQDQVLWCSGQLIGPGALNIVLWPIFKTRCFGKCPEQDALAIVQRQLVCLISRARCFCQYTGLVLQLMSNTRYFGQCPEQDALVNAHGQVLCPRRILIIFFFMYFQ